MLPIKHSHPGVSALENSNRWCYPLTDDIIHHFYEAIILSKQIIYMVDCTDELWRQFLITIDGYRDKENPGWYELKIILDNKVLRIEVDIQLYKKNDVGYYIVDKIAEEYYGGSYLINNIFDAIEDRLGKPISEITNGREFHI
jgi:hypothetical protein